MYYMQLSAALPEVSFCLSLTQDDGLRIRAGHVRSMACPVTPGNIKDQILLRQTKVGSNGGGLKLREDSLGEHPNLRAGERWVW